MSTGHARRRQRALPDRGTLARRLSSGVLWGVTALVAVLCLPILTLVFLVTAPFDPGRYAAGRVFRGAARMAVLLNPYWKFRTSGVHVRDPRRPYVAVSNHESYADIFLISHLPWEMKWLSKDAVFRIPVMGWMMRMAGDIPVVRDNARSRGEALDGLRDRLRKRVSVMVMPEGTRSPTDQMLPFRDGAFRVAVEFGVPVLPIVVAGTREAMAKGSFRFNRALAEARVLEPVETAGLTAADVPRLREEVRERIRVAREELRQELAAQAAGHPRAREDSGDVRRVG